MNFSSKIGLTQTTPLDELSQNYISESFTPTQSSETTTSKLSTIPTTTYNSLSVFLSEPNVSNFALTESSVDNSSVITNLTTNSSKLVNTTSQGAVLPQLQRYTQPRTQVNSNLEDNKILAADQAPQSYNGLALSESHPNFSLTGPTLSSNYTESFSSATNSLYTAYNDSQSKLFNKPMATKLLSSSLFFSGNAPSVLSNSFALGSADLLTSSKQATISNMQANTTTLLKQRTAVSPLLNGPREKAPAIVNALYWNMFYQNPRPQLRLEPIFATNKKLNSLYAPYFDLYSEYDFSNSQGIMRLEDNL